MTDATLDPGKQLYAGPTGFQSVPSDMTLHDLQRSKITVILFDVKYAMNGNIYDVGLNGDHRHCPLTLLCMTLRC